MNVIYDITDHAAKHCSTCKHETEVDRAECNACARAWNSSGYTKHINWEPK